MVMNSNELKRLIAEKNRQLDSRHPDTLADKAEIYRLKTELDKLLYQYYKSLKRNCCS